MSVRKTMKAVILAGGCDFGRSELARPSTGGLAASLPTALWPVAGKPALQLLLDSLADQGMAKAVVCSNGQSSMLAESVRVPLLPCQSEKTGPMKVEFRDETLPVGTAGAFRDAARGDKESVFFIFPAAIVCPPKIEVLLNAHRQGESDLTVMFNPGCGNGQALGDACQLPWPDKYFDVVYSNTVIEQLGHFEKQKKMAAEIMRVGKRWFVTTPNRWYPFEFDLRLPLVSWLRGHSYVWVGRIVSYNHVKNKYMLGLDHAGLRLMTASELKRCFPNSKTIKQRVTFMAEILIVVGEDT